MTKPYKDNPDRYFKATDSHDTLYLSKVDKNTYDNVLSTAERSTWNAWAASNESHPVHQSMQEYAAAGRSGALKVSLETTAETNKVIREATGMADKLGRAISGGVPGDAGYNKPGLLSMGKSVTGAFVPGQHRQSIGAGPDFSKAGTLPARVVATPVREDAVGRANKRTPSLFDYFDKSRRIASDNLKHQLLSDELWGRGGLRRTSPRGREYTEVVNEVWQQGNALGRSRATILNSQKAKRVSSAIQREIDAKTALNIANHTLSNTPLPINNVSIPHSVSASMGTVFRSIASNNVTPLTNPKVSLAGTALPTGSNQSTTSFWAGLTNAVSAGFTKAIKGVSNVGGSIGSATNYVGRQTAQMNAGWNATALGRLLGSGGVIGGGSIGYGGNLGGGGVIGSGTQLSLFPHLTGGGGSGGRAGGQQTGGQHTGGTQGRSGFVGGAARQIRHAAVWSAYAPAFAALGTAGAGLIGALPAQQKEAQAAWQLGGVGYNKAMMGSAMFAGRMAAGSNLFMGSDDYLRGLYEISSGFPTSPNNLHEIMGMANHMTKYRLFSHENMAKGTQQAMRLSKQFQLNPHYRGMSDAERLQTISTGAGKTIEMSLMKGQDIATYSGYAGPTLMRMNWSPGMSLAMGAQLTDVGLPSSTAGVAMRKFDTSMRASLTKMQIAEAWEKEQIAAGKKGSATYFPFHRMRSPWSSEKGNAMLTLNGMPLYKVFRQRMMQNFGAWQSGDPDTVANQLQELSAQAQYWIGERGVPLSRLGIPEQSWPAIQAMGTPGFIEDWKKRARSIDDTEGNRKKQEKQAKEANSPTTAPEAVTRFKQVAPGFLSSLAERLGLTQTINSMSDKMIFSTAGTEFRSKLSKGDYTNLLRSKELAMKEFDGTPHLQAGIASAYAESVYSHLDSNGASLKQTAEGQDIYKSLSDSINYETMKRYNERYVSGIKQGVINSNTPFETFVTTHANEQVGGNKVYHDYDNRYYLQRRDEFNRRFNRDFKQLSISPYRLSSPISRLTGGTTQSDFKIQPEEFADLDSLNRMPGGAYGYGPNSEMFRSKLRSRGVSKFSDINFGLDPSSYSEIEETGPSPYRMMQIASQHKLPFNSLHAIGADKGTGMSGSPVVVNVYLDSSRLPTKTTVNSSGATSRTHVPGSGSMSIQSDGPSQ